MRLSLLLGLRPFRVGAAARDALAGVTLASMNISQVLGYTRNYRHARRHRPLHGAAAARCLRRLRLLAPSGGGGGLGDRGDLLQLVVSLGDARQRQVHGNNVKVVARGAGTSLSGGALPLEDGVLVSMMKFNKINEPMKVAAPSDNPSSHVHIANSFGRVLVKSPSYIRDSENGIVTLSK